MSRRFLILAVGIAGTGAVLWYVSAPPKGTDGYLERVAATSETVRSQVQTARIWVETHSDGEAMAAATLVGLRETEEDGKSALSEFEGFEPAPRTLATRDDLIRQASAAIDRLGAMRIAAGNPGCAIQIGAHLDIPVFHPMTLLDHSIRGTRP